MIHELGENIPDALSRIRRVLLRVAAARQVPPEDREDVVQEALLALSQQIEQGAPIRDMQGLAIAVLEKRILDYHRRTIRQSEITVNIDEVGEQEPAAPDLEEAYARQEALARMDGAAAAVLSPAEQAIYEMMKLGYTCYEIAEARGVDPHTITSQQSDIRKKLTEEIHKENQRARRASLREISSRSPQGRTPETENRQETTKRRRETL